MPSHRLASARTPQAARPESQSTYLPFKISPGALVPVLLAAISLLAGCAVPGEPMVRHPITPQPVADLVARQQGDAVVLSFTLPKNSTDDKPLAALPTIEVYRTVPPLSAASGAALAKPTPRLADSVPGTAVQTYVKNGRVEIPDQLNLATWALAPGQQVSYFVRTRLSPKRASANSNAVVVPVFPAPPPVGALRATVTEPAIVLDWTAPPTPPGTPSVTGYRVYRSDSTPPVDASAPAQATALKSNLELLGQPAQPEYRDTTFQLDHAYLYIVRSVAQFGSVTVESADSVPLVVFAKDVFPPGAPQGLETVIVPATGGMPAYVELAWNISPEEDLAGYTVFRSEQGDSNGTSLTSELPAPTFRDMTALPGHHYFYRVAAVDRDGNVSPLSSPAEADVP